MLNISIPKNNLIMNLTSRHMVCAKNTTAHSKAAATLDFEHTKYSTDVM